MIKAILAGIALALSINASAAEGKLCVPTDVGNVVITSSPCEIKFDAPNSFKYRAFATEGNATHEGCWFAEDNTVYVLYPELQQDDGDQPIAVYNPKLFKKCVDI